MTAEPASSSLDLDALQTVRDHVARGALNMVDEANHKPENRGRKPKVGGHQASSMSSVDLLCALYLHTLRRPDRVAVKPHAAPVVYALMHLMGVLPRAQMSRLRERGGPQPYPTQPKDPRFVDYTTSSEALGVCATIYDALAARVQDRQLAPRVGARPVDSRYWGLCGDGELTEGQIDESLYDAGRWKLDRVTWIVDLNRQSLDRVMDDSGRLESWAAAKFRSHGWEVRTLRWGARAEALFAREGGPALRRLLDGLADDLFHPLLLLPGHTVRRALLGHVPQDATSLSALLARYAALPVADADRRGIARALDGVDDAALAAAVGHLGGHDLGAVIAALADAAAVEGAPAVVIAHTVKGYQTSAAAHPENHGMLLPEDEVAAWGGLGPDRYPAPPAGSAASALLARRAAELFAPDVRAVAPPPHDVPSRVLSALPFRRRDVVSTGEAFQSLNLALLRTELAPWVQFGAPDVGQTTHLGPVIKETGVFAPVDAPDTWAWLRDDKALTFNWRASPTGQFHSMGIAEGNAMLWAWAFGRDTTVAEGRHRFLSVVTVYDKFFERGFNQLDYAAYSHARFVAVGVPSGTGLSRETGTHQSTQTLRMMMDLPGILAYEPAFAADVHAIYLHALAGLWHPDGEAVYLRLTTQPLDQPVDLPDDHAAAAVRGAYWLVGADDRAAAPGQPTVVFVASGRKVADARAAAAVLHADGIGSRVLVVTSYEALWREWDAWASDPAAWDDPTRTYTLHDLFDDDLLNAPMIVTGDHVPSVSEWLPGALHRVRGARFLGPRGNSEAGDLPEIDALHGMGVPDLVAAARAECAFRARHGIATGR